MMTVDQWRQSEAEARQESCTRKCADCGDEIEDCDAFECTACGMHFCHRCVEQEKLCFDCSAREALFNKLMADEFAKEESIQRDIDEKHEEEIFRRKCGQTSHHDSHQRQISWD